MYDKNQDLRDKIASLETEICLKEQAKDILINEGRSDRTANLDKEISKLEAEIRRLMEKFE